MMNPPRPSSTARAPSPASTKLRQAPAQLVGLLWTSPIPALLLGPDDRLLDVNPAFAEFSGFARDELIGVDPIDLQPPEDRAEQRALSARLREEADRPAVARLIETRLIDASGRERWLRQARQRLLDAGGRRLTLVTLQDCSAEHAARERADRAARELDLAQMQIAAMMDTAGVGLATFQESTGWLPQPHGAGGGADSPASAAMQAVGRDIVLPESLPEFEKVQHALRHTLRAEARYEIDHPELGLRWLLTRVEPATLASGKRTTSVVTLDITEQQRTQQRSEQLLHELTTILESASTGIAYLRGNVLVRCNRRFEGMVGVPEGSGAGRSLQALFAHWPRASRMVEQTIEALAAEPLFETEFAVEEAVAPGADARWYSLSVRRTGADPHAVEAIAVLADVTRLKAQQREVERLARDRELMFSLSEVGIAFIRDGGVQRANEAFAALAGYPVEDVSELALEALFADRAEFMRIWAREDEQLRRRGRWSGERQLRRRDGQLLWVQVSKRLVDEGDPGGGMIASYVNVDARHRAEQAVTLQAERTRAILDSVLVGIVTVGAHGIEWMNRSARRMFGGDLAEFVGQPIDTVATSDPDHPFRQTQYIRSLFEGQAETFECRVKARDGREFWVVGNVVATGLERQGRQLTYALLDIERRRQAEARSEETQASLQRVIEMAPLAIALRDARTLRVLQLNQTAASIVGLPQADLIGRTPEEMHPPGLAEAMRADMQAALEAGAVTKREYGITTDGESRLWDARYMPLGPPGEEPDQLLLVATDVTEQRAAQEARLEAAIAQREMLVKEVHHRIKNNLQGVAGLLQQIAARKPEVESVISEVVGQVQAIAQVYGLQVGVGGPLLLRSVVEAITGSVQRTFGRVIALTVEGVATPPWALPEAESIPIALTINELLTNAIKHSRGDEPAVSCTLVCNDAGVRIAIANAGTLVPDFKLAHIPGGVSGLGLVRALMPRRSATLNIEQEGERVVATLSLVPPGITRADVP